MAKKRPKKTPAFIPCVLRALPEEQQTVLAERAILENPANAPLTFVSLMASDRPLDRQALAVLTSRYFGPSGVDLDVYFMDTRDSGLKARILEHMNAWQLGGRANIRFRESASSRARVRIARKRGDGYWSYLGTDVLSIPTNQPTMNLDSFTLSTPESEYRRVVRHETGHTLGYPHEHLRSALIARLDRAKTIAFFRRNYGWDERTTVSNVLTPLSEQSLIGTTEADPDSVMCYQLSGECTKDGQPIPGGDDINELDASHCARLYPGVAPPPPPPPPPGEERVVIDVARKTVSLPPGWSAA